MAAFAYTYETTINFGGDEPTAELDVKVRYSVAWGAPAKGPAYSHGGLPADPPEITDIELVTVDGMDRNWSAFDSDAAFAERIVDKLWASDRDLDAMLEEASEEDASRQDAADEARWESGRDSEQSNG